MKRDERIAEHSTKEIGLRIRRQKGALGYSRERLAKPPEISNFPLSDIERGNRGFSAASLGRLSRVLGFSADYILFGTEQVTGVSAITDMLSSPDRKYLLELEELLGAYLKMIAIAEKQDD